MIKLLNWIEKEGFVLYKDGTWYSPKRFKGVKSIYYKHEELLKLFKCKN